MIKRVNFTGRRRIPRERVRIEVVDGRPRVVNATINLDGIPLLPGAAVFLEAMCAGSPLVQRFDCGAVERLAPLRNAALHDLEGENVFFTLKVVDRTERFGRILGIADNLRPERSGPPSSAGRRGILPLEPQDLGDEIWRLEFRVSQAFLLVNNQIPGLIERVRTDPLFYAAVYPVIVRNVLSRAVRENVEVSEDEERWAVQWLRFGMGLHPAHAPPPQADDPADEIEDWVEEVVGAFCRTHSLRSKYLAALSSALGGDP